MSLIYSSSRGYGDRPKKEFVSPPYHQTTKHLESLFPSFSSEYSLYFNGSSSDITNLGNTSELDGVGKSFTVEFWLKLRAYPATFNGVVFSNRNNEGYMIAVQGESQSMKRRMAFDSTLTSGTRFVYGTTQFELGVWYHVAITHEYRGSSTNIVCIYVNGELEAINTSVSNIGSHQTPPRIGYEQSAPSDYHLNGQLDEFRYWRGAKTQDEIRELMYKSCTGQEPNLLLNYRFEEGTGAITKNSVNSHAATINTPTWSMDVPKLEGTNNLERALANEFLAETVEYYNAIVANGGNISVLSLRYVDEFVRTLKADNVWDKINDMGVFCGTNLNAALTKLKHKSTPYITSFNIVSADYTERGSTGGIKGNGSNKYMLINYSGGYTSTNAHISAYVIGKTSSSDVFIGHQNSAGTYLSFMGRINAGAWDAGTINATSFPTHYVPQSQTAQIDAHWLVSNNGSSSQSFYHNGVKLGASVNNSGSSNTLTASIGLLCYMGTSPVSYSSRTMAFYSVGLGLDASEAQKFAAAIGTLQGRLKRQTSG